MNVKLLVLALLTGLFRVSEASYDWVACFPKGRQVFKKLST